MEESMNHDKRIDHQNSRRHFSPEDKVKMLRLHLLEKVPISEVCEKHQITPTQFYQWQKILFENGVSAFAKSSGPRVLSQIEQRANARENKLRCKDEVIAEIMADYIVLKKAWGKLSVTWVVHDIRDEVVDFVSHWTERAEL